MIYGHQPGAVREAVAVTALTLRSSKSVSFNKPVHSRQQTASDFN